MAKTINSVRVSGLSRDGIREYGERCALDWNDEDGIRYHVWMHRQADGSYTPDGTLYKNPPTHVERPTQAGYFRTIKMDLTGATGRWMLPLAMEHFEEELAAAFKRMEEELAKERAEHAKDVRRARIEEHAEEMYALLVEARSQLKTLQLEHREPWSNERTNMVSAVCVGAERIIAAVDGQNVFPCQ